MHSAASEHSFVDVLLPDRMGRNEKLERLNGALEWKKLARLVDGIYSSPTGRPSYPPLVMVKIMVL